MKFAANSSSSSIRLHDLTFEVLSAGGRTYVKANEATYRTIPDMTDAQLEEFIRVIGDRWSDAGDETLSSIAAFGPVAEFKRPAAADVVKRSDFTGAATR